MSRLIVVSFAIFALLQATLADDSSATNHIHVDLTDRDIVQTIELDNLIFKTTAAVPTAGFIGDLEIGERVQGEILYRHVFKFQNPTNRVLTTVVDTMAKDNEVIHYVNAQNSRGSCAVVCEQENSIGSRRGVFQLRSNPGTQTEVVVLIATHREG